MIGKRTSLFLVLSIAAAAPLAAQDIPETSSSVRPVQAAKGTTAPATTAPQINIRNRGSSFRKSNDWKILSGKARIAEVRQALSSKNTGKLINTIHALFNMRHHRGVITLLKAMWRHSPADKTQYPELDWNKIEQPTVRIAVASTLNRIYPLQRSYIKYVRSRAIDEHELNLAQVAIALGLNRNPKDVDYLTSLASGEKVYVVQSAITALAMMDEEKARRALVSLEGIYSDKPRGRLIRKVLRRAYPATAK